MLIVSFLVCDPNGKIRCLEQYLEIFLGDFLDFSTRGKYARVLKVAKQGVKKLVHNPVHIFYLGDKNH